MKNKTAKILIIDDEEMIRETVSCYLNDSGFYTSTAANGKEGLSIFNKKHHKAVLVDLTMPEMNGFEVLKTIHKESPEIPVIVISGTGNIHNVVEAQRLGAWDYITKPVIDMEIIVQAINKCIKKAELLLLEKKFNKSLQNKVKRKTSELIKVNKKLEASLKEKDILLKEIHHRVKNNMQIISSLLDLQSRYVQNETDRRLFKESQERVRSMAMVHEKLYQSEDLSEIDFKEYITDLTDRLFASYSLTSTNVKIKIDMKRINIGIDIAIPCALIINELISNSLLHAFCDNKVGEILIKFSKRKNNFTLSVIDNGIGISKDVDIENIETLGLKLVKALTQQLKGSISLSKDKGTNFKIKFKY